MPGSHVSGGMGVAGAGFTEARAALWAAVIPFIAGGSPPPLEPLLVLLLDEPLIEPLLVLLDEPLIEPLLVLPLVELDVVPAPPAPPLPPAPQGSPPSPPLPPLPLGGSLPHPEAIAKPITAPTTEMKIRVFRIL